MDPNPYTSQSFRISNMAGHTSVANSAHSAPAHHTPGIVGPVSGGVTAAFLLVVVLVFWRWKRYLTKKLRKTAVPIDLGEAIADAVFVGRSDTNATTEKRVVNTESQIMYTEEEHSEAYVPDRRMGTPSCQTDLGSNFAIAGAPHPSPTLSTSSPPPWLLPQPPLPQAVGSTSAYPHRQEIDGGIRLAGGGFDNDGNASEESFETLPPPYQAHYQ
ncbi:hypothetical protein EIP86_005347 [Pleurotus ostreatoroseus]|nr:hypothetical protein EIP86_005347 [Pleurotus ostreatoroseus]